VNPVARVESEPLPYQFEDLERYTAEEIELRNWWCAVFASSADWRKVAAEALANVIPEPARESAALIQTNSLEPDQPAQTVALDRDPIGIGRATDNDIVLPAKTITKYHARLSHTGGQWTLEDLSSNLGTHRGERKMAPGVPEPLHDGQQFTIFPYTFELRIETEWKGQSRVDIAEPVVSRASWGEFAASGGIGRHRFPMIVASGADPVWIEAGDELTRAVADRILDQAMPTIEITDCDGTLMQFVLLSAIERLNREFKFPLHIRFDTSAEPEAGERGYAIELGVAVGEIQGLLRMFAPAGLFAGMRPEPKASTGCRAAWDFAFSCGFIDLGAADRARIEPGDVLLYESEPRVLFPGRWTRRWRASIENAQPWTFRIDNYGEEILEMNDATPSFGDLPVRIHIVVGEKEMTLAELQGVAPGSIIALGRGKQDPVKLAVNGKLAGEGQLVEIDGRLGVKVLSWSAA
jgi:flagellar motor switch/type III secretory pathway protein FliN/pSer/pThr/pTyr-binding forkhead associated (FHA) protein